MAQGFRGKLPGCIIKSQRRIDADPDRRFRMSYL
jgi:hypothetical protein